MVSDDVQQAFVTKWLADTGAGNLAALVPAGPKIGAIPSPLPAPYCHMLVRQEKEPEVCSGGPTIPAIHWQRVVLTVFGIQATTVTIADRINTVFGDASMGATKVLAVPNSTHMRTQIADPGTPERDSTRSSDTEEIWKAVVQYVVWLSRTTP